MTYEEVLELAHELDEDLIITECGGNIHIDVFDLEGFTEDWEEIYRDYDEEVICEFLATLERTCTLCDGDFYTHYHYDGFEVIVGYTSYDI